MGDPQRIDREENDGPLILNYRAGLELSNRGNSVDSSVGMGDDDFGNDPKLVDSIHNFQNYVMGESGCMLTVLDVADALQGRFAFISGGKTDNGCSILTFADTAGSVEVSDDTYKNVVTYLTSIPTLQEADLGFVVILDRRQDKWNSVKTMLLRISGFFPGLVHEVYVLRPAGFFQRTFTDMGFKFVKDDFKFKVLMCSSLEELHEHMQISQLTKDLGGSIEYDHSEWISQRAAIEKFSANTNNIGQTLKKLCENLQKTEFPNDVAATESLINNHMVAKQEVTEDLGSTIKHGEILLGCFKTGKDSDSAGGASGQVSSESLPVHKLAHVTAIERLLVQLEETQRNFDEFWERHEKKLQQCLQLRRFEEDFKQLHYSVDKSVMSLKAMTETGDSLHRVETLIKELHDLETCAEDDVCQGEKLAQSGERFIEEDHYAVDCIRPKCLELQMMCQQYREMLRERNKLLQHAQDLQDRIDKANKWCTRGVDLLANQSIDKCNTAEGAQVALTEIDAFLATASELRLNDPQEFHQQFQDIMTDDTQTSVTYVLGRIEDVQQMCDRRKSSLRKLLDKPPRPVQPVMPESVRQTHPSGSRSRGHRFMRKNSLPVDLDREKLEVVRLDGLESYNCASIESSDSDSPYPTSPLSPTNSDTLQAKRGEADDDDNPYRHVMKELIDTERAYVAELKAILEGYADEMENPHLRHLMPQELIGKKHILFGNMSLIYDFHAEVFLKDLENCRQTPALVGKCFVDRREEFQMYSEYCQNKPAAEALRRQVGDNNPFFKECQKKLKHRLPLGAYLLKPVQRITKYQLLLKEMLKYSQNEAGNEELREAVDSMLGVLKYVNDLMHQVAITGFPGRLADQGKLLMQGSFNVWTEHKKDKIKDLRFKPMQRHVFLYEKLVLFCKKREDPQRVEKATYTYKSSLEMASVGLTESIKSDKRKFELWLHGRAEVYIIQAPTTEVKAAWVTQIKKVLLSHFNRIKESAKSMDGVPTIPLSRSNSTFYTPTTPEISPTSQEEEEVEEEELELTAAPVFELVSPTAVANRGANHDDTESASSTSDDFELAASDTSQGRQHHRVAQSVSDNDLQFEQEFEPVHFIVMADYQALDATELTLRQSDRVEVLKVGSDGWWYVQLTESGLNGWAPASFMEPAKRNSTISSQSTTSSTFSTLSTGSAGKMVVGHAVGDTEA